MSGLELSPDHFINDTGVALDDFHDLGTHVFFDVVGHRDAVITISVHRDGSIDSLQQRLFVNASDKEASLVDCFGAFGTGTNAHSRERVADTREERTFFGERAAIAHNGKSIHLQAVVVMETKRFMLNHTLVKLKATCCKAVAATRVATVQNRHVILFSHLVDCRKETIEVLFSIDIFFAVGAQQNVLALGKTKARMNIACFDRNQVLVQDFCHRATRHVSTFLGQATVRQITASMFRISHIHIANNINDAAVSFFGQAFILATVPRFHMENGNVQALCRNCRKAAISIAKDKHGIGLASNHQLVAAVDDVAYRCAQVIAHGIHIDFRILEVQVLEEHAVQVVVVVLAGVRQNAVKVLAALVDDRGKADDFGALRAITSAEFR